VQKKDQTQKEQLDKKVVEYLKSLEPVEEDDATSSVAVLPANIDELIQTLDETIVSYLTAPRLPAKEDFKTMFELSLEFEDFLRVFKERVAVSALTYVPAAVHAMGKLAAQGDVPAARVLFTLAGMDTNSKSGSTSNVLTQVNVNVPTLKDMVVDASDSTD